MSSTGNVDRLRDAIELLEAIASDRTVLEGVPAEDRQRLLQAVALVYSPDRSERRRMAKAAARDRKAQRVKQDEAARAETGIRTLRQKPIFHTPNVFPPESSNNRTSRTKRARHGRRERGSRTEPRAPALLRLQAEVHADPSLLRPDVPAVRRAELREAHRARRPSRPRGALDGRAREDRISGGPQAASLGRAPHRDDALSAGLGVAIRARARLRRVGRSSRDLRARPAAHAERRGVLPPDACRRATASTSSSTTRARPCAGRRRSTRT